MVERNLRRERKEKLMFPEHRRVTSLSISLEVWGHTSATVVQGRNKCAADALLRP